MCVKNINKLHHKIFKAASFVINIYRVAQKVVHFSAHHIFGTVQDKTKRISPKCPHQSFSRTKIRL